MSSRSTLRAVTLDAAGTLIELAEPVGVTYTRVAAAHAIALEADALEERFRAAFAAAPPLAFPGARSADLAERERAWWYAVVARAFGSAARNAAFDTCFADLYALYAGPAAWRVVEGGAEALERLRAAGLALAVVSNFDGRLPGILAGLGLAPRLDTIVYSARAGYAKPQPGIFHDALARLGVAPPHALHVGDSLRLDVEGAHAAGLDAVLVDRGAMGSAAPRVRSIRSLAELPALLTLF